MAKILIIDDDESAVFILRGYAVCSGHEVEHASSVQEALIKVKKVKYSLIFLDFLMPEYSGEDFLKIYSATYPDRNTPIVVVSSDRSQETYKASIENGARGYLAKPVNKLEMLRLIDVYCAG